MKVLFIVHVEPMFNNLWDNNYLDNIATEMESHDHVVVLNSGIDRHYYWLHTTADEVWEWSWGYEPRAFHDKDEERYVIPAHGHEWTWIPPEMRNKPWITKQDLYLAGGGYGECFQDWMDVLDELELPYTILHDLVY